MNNNKATQQTIEILLTARRIADHASIETSPERDIQRATYDHLGAVIADSILQAGLNYTTVVQPRVQNIIKNHPAANTLSSLLVLVEGGKSKDFLNWNHHEKIYRFESLIRFLKEWGIEDTQDLRTHLELKPFCRAVQTVHGIGPKTVDYMACLVGIDSIAVDRHVRAFAKQVGVQSSDYHFLQKAFCYAADLLAIPRREFDSWLWKRATYSTPIRLH